MRRSLFCSSAGSDSVHVQLEGPLDIGESSVTLIDTSSGSSLSRAFFQVANGITLLAALPASLPATGASLLITVVAQLVFDELKMRQISTRMRVSHSTGSISSDIITYEGRHAVIRMPSISVSQPISLILMAPDSVGFYDFSNSIQLEYHDAPRIEFVMPSQLV
jgi:hypothetical protein